VPLPMSAKRSSPPPTPPHGASIGFYGGEWIETGGCLILTRRAAHHATLRPAVRPADCMRVAAIDFVGVASQRQPSVMSSTNAFTSLSLC
jgi:hypothetical protein